MNPRALLLQMRAPAVVAVVYLILRRVFVGITEHGGLISPSGSVNAGVAILGASVIVLRIVVLFVVPAVIAYRLVAHFVPPPGKRGGDRSA